MPAKTRTYIYMHTHIYIYTHTYNIHIYVHSSICTCIYENEFTHGKFARISFKSRLDLLCFQFKTQFYVISTRESAHLSGATQTSLQALLLQFCLGHRPGIVSKAVLLQALRRCCMLSAHNQMLVSMVQGSGLAYTLKLYS